MKMHRGGFLREADLRELGIGQVGENVRVHESCVLAGLEYMRFGSNIRIDAFCVLTASAAGLVVGDFVHVGAHCTVLAAMGIRLGDFSGLSAGVRLFSHSDDYGGEHLTNPTIPADSTASGDPGPITLGRHTIVGAQSVVLPTVTTGEGVAVGGFSLVNRDLAEWGMYGGVPAKLIRPRRRDLLQKEQELRAALAAGTVVPPTARL